MIKVMVFGTFDILHPGHKHFLNEAKKRGHLLVAVVACDITVKQLKQKEPVHNEQQRIDNLKALHIADKVIIGSKGDKYAAIDEEKPDIICLGYDQKFFTRSLGLQLKKKKLNTKVVRITPHKPDTFKSSMLRKKISPLA